MRISECREEDVPLLDAHMPSPVGLRHATRFARHREGVSTFLLAWQGERPVGSCEVRWSGCEAPEVRSAHPGVPEIHGLGGWPETLRSPGTGAALIRYAEQLAQQRGLSGIGIGMEKNNPHAEDLFTLLGYRPFTPYLDCWSYEDSAGVGHRVADARIFMAKRLPQRQEQPARPEQPEHTQGGGTRELPASAAQSGDTGLVPAGLAGGPLAPEPAEYACADRFERAEWPERAERLDADRRARTGRPGRAVRAERPERERIAVCGVWTGRVR